MLLGIRLAMDVEAASKLRHNHMYMSGKLAWQITGIIFVNASWLMWQSRLCMAQMAASVDPHTASTSLWEGYTRRMCSACSGCLVLEAVSAVDFLSLCYNLVRVCPLLLRCAGHGRVQWQPGL